MQDKISPEKEFDEFLSNLMFQTKISKQDLKEIFISWFRYSIAKLKKDKYMWIPFIGTFKLHSKKNRKVPNGRSHHSAPSIHKEINYLQFKSSPLVKKLIYNRDISVVEGMVKKIEEYYMGIINS